MPERPGQWDLLDRPSDPVVADTAAIESRVAYFRSLADAMRTEGQRLSQIASGEALVGKYADELRSASGDVAKDLNQVVGRYDAVVRALVEFQPAVDVALTGSASALDDAIDANTAQRQADAMPVATPAAGTPLTPQQEQSNADKISATDAAAGRLEAAKAKLAGVLTRLDDAGRQAASTVRGGFNDGLTDSGWDRFKYAFKKFLAILVKVLTYIGMALSVLALVIPGIGELVFAAGLALGAVVLAADVALKAMGGGSWADIGIAIAGLLTFGAAKILGPAINSGLRSAMATMKGALGSGTGIAEEVGSSAARLLGEGGEAGESAGSGAGSIASRASEESAGSGAESGEEAAGGAGEDALTKYLGGGAQNLNKYLREVGDVTDPAMEASASEVSSQLNSIEPIAGEIKTFRGVTGNLAQGLKRGDTFTDKAFMSTSTNRSTVDEFIATGGTLNGRNTEGVATRFEIDSFGAGRDVSKFTGLDEGEVLFDRGTTFEVGGVKSVPETLRVNGQEIKVHVVYLNSPGMELD
ncbi:MAG: hypothetical protein QOH55_1535 [Microbacteriaceae bacterium]|nr:hypothetical protein [Microbacteriaceae bacterium]